MYLTSFASGFINNKSLKRLRLQCCGLTDEGVRSLVQNLDNNPELTTIDFGQGSYAETPPQGMQYNQVGDGAAQALAELVQKTPIKYLDISYSTMSQAGLNLILDAVRLSPTILYLDATPLGDGGEDAQSVAVRDEARRLHGLVRERLHANVEREYGLEYVEFEREHKRFLLDPPEARLVDSVYRNRDPSPERQGLKTVEKWWMED